MEFFCISKIADYNRGTLSELTEIIPCSRTLEKLVIAWVVKK
jgi:hypothetical protein